MSRCVVEGVGVEVVVLGLVVDDEVIVVVIVFVLNEVLMPSFWNRLLLLLGVSGDVAVAAALFPIGGAGVGRLLGLLLMIGDGLYLLLFIRIRTFDSGVDDD